MNILHGELVLSKEDSNKIRKDFHEDCTLTIGDFEMKFVMHDVSLSRSGEKIKTTFRMQKLDEFMEQNTVTNQE